jgi:hypothetical protein
MCESAITSVPCFLESAPWQQLLQSMIIPDQPFSRRGRIGVGTLCIKATMPRLLYDVTSAVSEPANVDSVKLLALLVRLRKFRAFLVNKYTELTSLSTKASISEIIVPPGADERPELFGDILSLLIMGCRMLCAVSMDEVRVLEDEALIYSYQLVELERKTRAANCLAGFVLCQKLTVAEATLTTSPIWRNSPSSMSIIERRGFKAWCDAIPVRCNFS